MTNAWDLLAQPEGWREYIAAEIAKEKEAKRHKQAEQLYLESTDHLMDQWATLEAQIREDVVLRHKFAGLRAQLEADPEYRARIHPQVLEAIFSVDLGNDDE